VLINHQRGEVSFKVVYYGVGGGGKTTNVEFIHDHINPQLRGGLVSVKTEGDRTLFFDFLYVELTTIKGLKPKFNVYTVPGQPMYTASRRLVLRGVDGVVFVADSQGDRLQENIESLTELGGYLKEKGSSLSEFPFVLQCNKQDLSSAVAPDELSKQLGLNGQPRFGAIATEGKSVFDTMKAIITLVSQRKM
jgi:mutual gliding-motility protein MglA